MWVFGYGSLMWDGWEAALEGTRTDHAVLSGYRRSFNKKSTERWGTAKRLGPTLGLEPEDAAQCIGTAFEFPEAQRAAVLQALREREGPSFHLPELSVTLPDGRTVQAVTPVNDHTKRTYIGNVPLAERVAMARVAKGADGLCVDYVLNISARLQALGIADAAVEEFAAPFATP
jgi:glutathione-specific gamma-glutamylcyclotransferase